MKRGVGFLSMILVAAGSTTVRGDDSIVGSPHDLSMLSPNTVKAVAEDRVCIFCHVPHNSQPQAPAWNRFDPELHYRVYQSSTTDARIGQPSGPSKMCLSCHDGLMALGMVGSGSGRPGEPPADHPIVMTRRFMPPGPTNLTNDLSDDHPIGFRYDRALARRDAQLRVPDLVSREIPLGKHKEVHCTACHDPHNNRLGDFLRITDRRATLCLTCHDLRGWHDGIHATAAAATTGRRVDPSERLKYATMTDNGCAVCHKIHSAPQPQRLLRSPREEENCLNCHDGMIAQTDIVSEIRKSSAHRSDTRTGVHDPRERELSMQPHAECVDCHNPHAAQRGPAIRLRTSLPVIADGAVRGAKGISLAGLPKEPATFIYEICFRCHADNPIRTRTRTIRQVSDNNVRRQFQPSNPSYHPVAAPRRNADVVSLLPPYRNGVVISCTDCHNADDAKAIGGPGPNGPHGSRWPSMLVERYETRDFTTESAAAYALCYRCHDRTSILRDDTFQFHRLHIVVARAQCATCHDPHGIPSAGGPANQHTNLINFDRLIVHPVGGGIGGLPVRFVDTGRYSGNCTLNCHGYDHVNTAYGMGGGGGPPRVKFGRLLR